MKAPCTKSGDHCPSCYGEELAKLALLHRATYACAQNQNARMFLNEAERRL